MFEIRVSGTADRSWVSSVAKCVRASFAHSVCAFVCAFMRSCICALVRSFVRACMRSCVGALARSCVGAFVRWHVRALACSCVGAFVRWRVRALARSCMRACSPACLPVRACNCALAWLAYACAVCENPPGHFRIPAPISRRYCVWGLAITPGPYPRSAPPTVS